MVLGIRIVLGCVGWGSICMLRQRYWMFWSEWGHWEAEIPLIHLLKGVLAGYNERRGQPLTPIKNRSRRSQSVAMRCMPCMHTFVLRGLLLSTIDGSC